MKERERQTDRQDRQTDAIKIKKSFFRFPEIRFEPCVSNLIVKGKGEGKKEAVAVFASTSYAYTMLYSCMKLEVIQHIF